MSNTAESGGASNRRVYFRRNVGGIDRAIRLTAGAAFLVFGLIERSSNHSFASGFSLLGLFIMAMAGIGFCPLYLPFGITTARRHPNRKAGE